MGLVLWWKFGAVKKNLMAGQGAVYDARSIGNKTPLVILHILTVKDTVYDVAEDAKGQDAWKRVEGNPDAVNASLTCPECGFQHVIRAEFANGMEKLTSCAFVANLAQGHAQVRVPGFFFKRLREVRRGLGALTKARQDAGMQRRVGGHGRNAGLNRVEIRSDPAPKLPVFLVRDCALFLGLLGAGQLLIEMDQLRRKRDGINLGGVACGRACHGEEAAKEEAGG